MYHLSLVFVKVFEVEVHNREAMSLILAFGLEIFEMINDSGSKNCLS